MRAIKKEPPALITTLQHPHEVSGDAESYGLSLLLASQVGIASIVVLSRVLHILAKMSASMQMEVADFSKLPILLEVTVGSLKSLKHNNWQWLWSI